MASVELDIAGRKYVVACRDGEEASLRSAAALVDGRARDAVAALGSLSEARMLLFAALMLADDVQGSGGAPATDGGDAIGGALEALAARLEAVTARFDRTLLGLEDRRPRA